MSRSRIVMEKLVVKLLGSKIPFNKSPWSISLNESGLIALVGPNGSGKTTFLRALLGELSPVEGQIQVTTGFPSTFAYLPQESDWDPSQTVKKHLEIAFIPRLGLFKGPTQEDLRKCCEISEELDLTSVLESSLGDLSSGLRQKAFLGRVLLQKASIYLLDEPTNHLDSETIKKVWVHLKDLSKKSAVIVASHDSERVNENFDVLIRMENGTLEIVEIY